MRKLPLSAFALAIKPAILPPLDFQKDRKLQELEGVIEKIRSTLKLSDVPFSPGNRSQSKLLNRELTSVVSPTPVTKGC